MRCDDGVIQRQDFAGLRATEASAALKRPGSVPGRGYMNTGKQTWPAF